MFVAETVVLIDGVGNGVIYQRGLDMSVHAIEIPIPRHLSAKVDVHVTAIHIETHRFEKVREYWQGMDIYRLAGSWRPTSTGLWPDIRHVNKMLATIRR